MVGRWHIVVAGIVAGLAASAEAAPSIATAIVPVRASVVKPLVLTSLQNLELGTIVLRPGTWSGATVSISQTGGLTCVNPNLTCTGSAQPARYQLTGSNKEVIQITAPTVTLVNQSDSSKTLQLVPSTPATITLPNSGNQGVQFAVGGALSLSSTTADGLYVGTMNVTVDYQ